MLLSGCSGKYGNLRAVVSDFHHQLETTSEAPKRNYAMQVEDPGVTIYFRCGSGCSAYLSNFAFTLEWPSTVRIKSLVTLMKGCRHPVSSKIFFLEYMLEDKKKGTLRIDAKYAMKEILL